MSKKMLAVGMVMFLLLTIVSSSVASEQLTDIIAAVKAVDFVGQGGGEVQFPTDRAYPTFSHWDYSGHWLEWEIEIPQDSFYVPAVMYGTNREYADRRLSLDGEVKIDMLFFSTGDFQVYDLGYFEPFEIEAGQHLIRIEVSGPEGVHAGVNPAWIAFVPFEVLMEYDDQEIIAAIEQKLEL